MNIDKLIRKMLVEVSQNTPSTEKVNVDDPEAVLKFAQTSSGCFPQKEKDKGIKFSDLKYFSDQNAATACGVALNTKYVMGTLGSVEYYFMGTKSKTKTENPDTNGDYYFETCKKDGSTVTPVSTGPVWTCLDFRATADVNKSQLSDVQQKQLNYYLEKMGSAYNEFPPEGYSTQTHDVIDITTISDLGTVFQGFPKNTKFIYKRKGLQNATPDQVGKLEEKLATLTPKMTLKQPEIGSTELDYAITVRALIPSSTQVAALGGTYDNFKGIKLYPESGELQNVKVDAESCKLAVKGLYNCKIKPTAGFSSGQSSDGQPGFGGGNECGKFDNQFKYRFQAYYCWLNGVYSKAKNIMGIGIKDELQNLLDDYTTAYGIGTFNPNLKESVRKSNTLNYTINNVVLESIREKKNSTISSIIRKNLMEEFRKQRK
jgi:hypothetical protein